MLKDSIFSTSEWTCFWGQGHREEKDRIEIAKICAAQDGRDTLRAIGWLKIENEKSLFNIILISYLQSDVSLESYSKNLFLGDYLAELHVNPNFASFSALLQAISEKFGIPFPEFFKNLFTEENAKVLSLGAQKALVKWGMLCISFYFQVEDDSAGLMMQEDLLERLYSYHDPFLRAKITECLFTHRYENEQWKKRSCSLKASLSWVLMCGYAKENAEKEIYAQLIDRFYTKTKDKLYHRTLDRFLYNIQKHGNSIDRQSLDRLAAGLFQDKNTFKDDLNVLATISDFLEQGFFDAIRGVTTVGEFIIATLKLTEKELGVPVRPKDFEKLAIFRKKRAPFTYVNGLKQLPEPQRQEALANYETFLKSVFDSRKSRFFELRYDKEKVPHLKTVFAHREELERAWRKGASPKKIDQIDITSFQTGALGRAPKKSIQNRMKEQILVHRHLGPNGGEKYPALFARLKGDENAKGTSEFEKAAIALFNSSPSDEEDKLTELVNTPSRTEFDQDVKGWIRFKKEDVQAGVDVVDTDDPADIFAAGDEVLGSCQRSDGDPNYNRGLLGYLLNGHIRLIAIKDKEGRIVTRALLRLLWDTDSKKPVLYLDHIYTRNNNPDYPDIIKAFAIERAKELELTLLQSMFNITPYSNRIMCCGGQAEKYVDALRGVQPKEYVLTESYVLSKKEDVAMPA